MTKPERKHRRHGPPGHHGHDRFSPKNFEAFVGRMLDRRRDQWQQPARVLRALGVRRDAVVADVGAGPGYFTIPLARAVGQNGRVYAVDPDSRSLERLRHRLEKHRAGNVTPVLSRGDDPHLPVAACDLVLIIDSYHHFPNGPAFLRRAACALKPGGRLVGIDFEKRETPAGPPVEHRIAREEFLRDARRAGLVLVAEHRFLPYQYFVVLRPHARATPAPGHRSSVSEGAGKRARAGPLIRRRSPGGRWRRPSRR